ncbi:MAG: M48 family metalloprotease [Sedimentisphaerales bacterium]|nr:M48 family metalloprotease [Sedimentisphaerales bacterium]
MGGLFYNLGRKAGPRIRKAKWIWHSMIGTEAETIQIENEVGRDLAREIRLQANIDRDPQVEKMLNETGLRLGEWVANESRTFSFEAVAGAEPNAFALPGGFIFVTRSIIELCNWDRDETAFIIAHEMGHVICKHAINRIMRDFAVTAASRAAPVHSAAVNWVKKVGMQYLESSYSQELEFQADRLGVRLAEAAGFKPDASIKLLRRLSELKSSENRIEIGNYFSTHPAFNERIRSINELLVKQKA